MAKWFDFGQISGIWTLEISNWLSKAFSPTKCSVKRKKEWNIFDLYVLERLVILMWNWTNDSYTDGNFGDWDVEREGWLKMDEGKQYLMFIEGRITDLKNWKEKCIFAANEETEKDDSNFISEPFLFFLWL